MTTIIKPNILSQDQALSLVETVVKKSEAEKFSQLLQNGKSRFG